MIVCLSIHPNITCSISFNSPFFIDFHPEYTAVKFLFVVINIWSFFIKVPFNNFVYKCYLFHLVFFSVRDFIFLSLNKIPSVDTPELAATFCWRAVFDKWMPIISNCLYQCLNRMVNLYQLVYLVWFLIYINWVAPKPLMLIT
jgi:hypothetical protein